MGFKRQPDKRGVRLSRNRHIHWIPGDAGIADEEEDAPADIQDTEKYALVPDKYYLDLATNLYSILPHGTSRTSMTTFELCFVVKEPIDDSRCSCNSETWSINGLPTARNRHAKRSKTGVSPKDSALSDDSGQ